MSDVLPCQGCAAPILVWPDDPYTATLTGDPTYPYFVLCPPEENCYVDANGNATQGGTLYYLCFGHLLSANYHAGDDLNVIAAGLVTFCQDNYGGEGPDPETSQNPIPVGSVPLYFNPEITATALCPDGSTFTFTVPAGQFVGRTQADATAAAQRYANLNAPTRKVCLGTLAPTELAIDVAASLSVTATGTTVAASGNTWVVSSGALPTGLVLSGDGPAASIDGTPTVAGSFTFDLKITTPTGETNSKSFTVCVVEIVNTSPLPDGTALSAAYSQTLTATACAVAPLSWQISAGALPPGLTLEESTGVISGTPTTKGDYAFTVLLQTSAT